MLKLKVKTLEEKIKNIEEKQEIREKIDRKNNIIIKRKANPKNQNNKSQIKEVQDLINEIAKQTVPVEEIKLIKITNENLLSIDLIYQVFKIK